MSPYYIKEIHYVDKELIIVIGHCNKENEVYRIELNADRLLDYMNYLDSKPKI